MAYFKYNPHNATYSSDIFDVTFTQELVIELLMHHELSHYTDISELLYRFYKDNVPLSNEDKLQVKAELDDIVSNINELIYKDEPIVKDAE